MSKVINKESLPTFNALDLDMEIVFGGKPTYLSEGVFRFP